jgi:hypothetical protein
MIPSLLTMRRQLLPDELYRKGRTWNAMQSDTTVVM